MHYKAREGSAFMVRFKDGSWVNLRAKSSGEAISEAKRSLADAHELEGNQPPAPDPGIACITMA